MTLVVAQKKGTIISAVSDTGVSQNDMPLDRRSHLPKIAIVSRDLAVAFAGSPELALQAMASLDPGASVPAIVRHFAEFHKAKEYAVDFILMFQGQTSKLIRITGGQTGNGLAHSAWIGDHSAFELFQAYRNDRERRPVVSALERPLLLTAKETELSAVTFKMIAAMRYVVLDSALPSVFGDIVAVSNADGEFEYRPYAFLLDEMRTSLALPRPLLARIEPELQELREYAASCFVTVRSSPRQGIAFHFLRGKLTFIYHGKRGEPLTSAVVAKDKNAEEFMELMRAEGCTEWEGQIASRLPPPKDYGIAAERWKKTDSQTLTSPRPKAAPK
jgi:hypothetical protein